MAMSKKPTIETQLAIMTQNIEYISKSIDELRQSVKSITDNLVVKTEFNKLDAQVQSIEASFNSHIQDYVSIKSDVSNIKRITYGLISIVLTGVVLALLGLIIVK